MASEAEHIQQARENVTLASGLGVGTRANRQWACTIFHYAVVHSIKAAASPRRAWVAPDRAIRPDTHDWDEAWISENAPAVYDDYRLLRITSRRARYGLHDPGNLTVSRCEGAARRILEAAAHGALIGLR